jgi:hypothetical protein
MNGRRRLREASFLLAAVFALGWVPSALAQGGITITHAGLTQGHLNATWTGPFPASGPTLVNFPEDPFVQVATRADTGSDGYFFAENVVTNGSVAEGERTWLDSDPLSPPTQAGTYTAYIRVHAWDNWLTWDSYLGLWDAGVVWSAVTPFTLTALAQRVLVRRGHYLHRRIHGRRRRVWIKPVYRTTYKWADS